MRSRTAFLVVAALFAAFTLTTQPSAQADTFGNGGDTFTIDFVTIGEAGNPADTNGYGAIGYEYRIGVHEVSTAMIASANALGALGLTPDVRPPNVSASGLSWNEAARFVNWLNVNSGYPAAYKFALQPGDPGYDPTANPMLWATNDPGYRAANPYRNSGSKYFLPSENEWYKAAYFNPGGSNYFLYPTAANRAPQPITFGTTPGCAVYRLFAVVGPAAATDAGGLSPFGTMAQGGNVEEWMETAFTGVNTNPASARTLRGGSWTSDTPTFLASTWRGQAPPDSPLPSAGFRVAAAGTNSLPILTLQSTTSLATPWQNVTLTPSMVTPGGKIDLGATPGGAGFYRLQIEIVQP